MLKVLSKKTRTQNNNIAINKNKVIKKLRFFKNVFFMTSFISLCYVNAVDATTVETATVGEQNLENKVANSDNSIQANSVNANSDSESNSNSGANSSSESQNTYGDISQKTFNQITKESIDAEQEKQLASAEQWQDLNDGVDFDLLDDPISYEVVGVSGKLQDNATVYLASLPKILRGNVALRRNEIIQKLNQSLEVFGYYHPTYKVKFKSKKSNKLIIAVEKGKALWIRSVKIQVLGEAMTDPRFMRMFRENSLKQYTVFTHTDYESLKSEMMNKAYSFGYFDTKFIRSVVYADMHENTADIELILDTGKGYRLGKIKYLGDTQYAKIISPLVTIEEGQSFAFNKFAKISSDLYNTGYFQGAEVIPEIESIGEGDVPVNIRLKRKKFNIMETGIGYSTDERLRGRLGWSMPLLNESGHSLLMQTKVSQKSQEFLVRYKIPRKNPLTDYYYLQLQQKFDDINDTDSKITSFQPHYVAKNTGVWQRDYWLNAQYEDFTQGYETGNGFVYGAGVSLTRSEIVFKQDPISGYRAQVSVFGTSKKVGADYSFLQVYGSFKYIVSPTPNSRFLMRLEQGANIGNDVLHIPPSFRFFTGGDTTIRGYGYKKLSSKENDKLIGGRYLSVATIETQFPIIDKVRLATFVDAGGAYNHIHENNDLYVGSGIGARIFTPVGLVRVDFGFGVSETHIPFHFHFGIGPDI